MRIKPQFKVKDEVEKVLIELMNKGYVDEGI